MHKQPTTIKVTYAGETKRVPAPSSYAELLQATQLSFGLDAAVLHSGFKFYFQDEEQELISISSQDDYADNSDFLQVSDDPSKAVPSLIYSNKAQDVANHLKLVMQSKLLNDSTFSSASVRPLSALGRSHTMKQAQ